MATFSLLDTRKFLSRAMARGVLWCTGCAVMAGLPVAVSAQDSKSKPDGKPAATLLAKSPEKSPGKGMALSVKAAPARAATLATEVSAVGTLVANESVMIRPEVAGRVAAIHFTEGQPVVAGARLLSLDAAEVNAQLEASRADERLASQRAERTAELYKKNFISQQALDDAREAARKSVARRQEDEVRVAKTELKAPFAGVIGLRQVSAGAYLRAGDDIARLDQINVMKLDFRVPETYLGKITREQPVRVRVDAYGDERFQGRVYAVETAVDEKTRTLLLRARVANPGARLKPGMFARVSLELDSRAGAVLVPEQAINPKGDKTFLFRVTDGKAELVPVTLGARRPGEVEITKGVAVGDIVITENQPMLQPGMPVNILPDKPPAKSDKPVVSMPQPLAK